jgi:tetratricopeptide (TPR) repeat protein
MMREPASSSVPRTVGWLRLAVLAVAFVLGLGACRVRGPQAPLTEDAARAEIARLQKHLKRHPDDNDAWRDLAHLHWLWVNETAEAVEILDRLAKQGDATARMSRTIIAHAHLDDEAVWANATAQIAAAAAAGDEGRPAERALRWSYAEASARFLDDVRDATPVDDRRFVAFFDGLDLSRLPVDVSQPLLSDRAAIERRIGGDYRSYYAAQGCAREWVSGPVEGFLGELELGLRHEDHAFTLDPSAQIAALSCVVRVWNPEPRSGIRRLRTVLEPVDERLRLDISAQQPIRVYLDDVLVHRTDIVDRWPARRAKLELTVEPGPHVLEVRTAIPEDRAWIHVRATGRGGAPVPSRAAAEAAVVRPYADSGGGASGRARGSASRSRSPVGGGIYQPLREYLSIEDALADGDSDRAENAADRLREMGDGFAEGHLILSDFEDLDPSRGRNASASRRQLALERALAMDAGLDRARLLLLEHRVGEGEGAEVLAEFERLGDEALDTVDGHLLRWTVYLERGSDYLAERALARAAELDPESCEVLLARRRMAKRLDQVAIEDQITAKLDRCAGTVKLRSRLAHQRGDTAEAERLLDTQIDRIPDDLDALESRAAVAFTDGRYADAIRDLERVLELAPYRATANVNIADALAQDGKYARARASVRAAIDRLPHNGRLREIGESIGLEDSLMEWRVSGLEALESYRKQGDTPEGVKEVLVLDRDVAEVYASGGQRHIIHQIAHLQSKDALDTYGEIVLPEGARVLTLHSIKPDGTVVEPELIPGKDGLSLRNLEIGDFVEMEYVIEREPFTAIPGHVDLSRFRFQSLDTPYHRSQLLVVAPKSMKIEIESRNGAPKARRSERDGKQVIEFLAERMPRKGSEPQSRSMLDELPMVRVYTALDTQAWLRTIALQMREAQRSNPELRKLVAEILDGVESEYAKAAALHAWVMENVEEGGNLSTHATRTLAAREGNRLMLLRAMARAAGLRTEVWLARDAFGPRILEGGHPMIESYEAPVLAVWVDGNEVPLVLATIAKAMPPGYLLPAYSGSEAMRVQLADDERDPGPVRLPENPARLADSRSYELDFRLDDHGDGQVQGRIELQGMEALLWRSVLENIDEDRRGERFQEGELAVIGAGASLDLKTLDIDNIDDHDAPLVLRFTASAKGVGVVQGGELIIPAALVPMNLGLGYTQLPRRWSGMIVPYAPVQQARISIELTPGQLHWRNVAQDVDIETAHGSYARKTVEGGKGESKVVIETRATLTTGIVEASEYARMAEMTRAIQDAEQAILRVK